MRELLARKLESVGILTQPEVACRVLDLVSRPDAQVADFAKIIKTDPGLSGRLLRLVNSAFFAQSKAVTSLERAAALLGIERLKSFALGFYLAKGAASEPGSAIGREIWGQSVYRACLAAELARKLAPRYTSEAFIIALMMDCAVPLMPRLVGDAYLPIYEEREGPVRLFSSEFRRLPFTHIDAAVVMLSRWKIPELLTKPIEYHHTPPKDQTSEDPIARLHRIAYYVGAVDLQSSTGIPGQGAPLPTIAARVLGTDAEALAVATSRAAAEYRASIQLFSQMAQCVPDLESLAERAHLQLVDALDRQLGAAASVESGSRRFNLGGFSVELLTAEQGEAVAVLFDSTGNALLRHRFPLVNATPESIRLALGLEQDSSDQVDQMAVYLRRMAA